MNGRKVNKTCLRCKYYRPVDEIKGKCRLGRGKIDPSAYPEMAHEDSCDSWKDAGQQYHIRIGWIKNIRNNKEGEINE